MKKIKFFATFLVAIVILLSTSSCNKDLLIGFEEEMEEEAQSATPYDSIYHYNEVIELFNEKSRENWQPERCHISTEEEGIVMAKTWKTRHLAIDVARGNEFDPFPTGIQIAGFKHLYCENSMFNKIQWLRITPAADENGQHQIESTYDLDISKVRPISLLKEDKLFDELKKEFLYYSIKQDHVEFIFIYEFPYTRDQHGVRSLRSDRSSLETGATARVSSIWHSS